ncbi:pyrroloquinoline quinone-dependent dehydrogenase [Pelagibacterium luteolum]|uniref:Alcohol dehydrogenase (Cytochrome c) n=1 Tax=Pelagibacterium luteolum TaxID=440168 RepID=A0A1G7WD71_9HYPH|nr:PQQ-binding-like beta-propeller repeat protein [Pelagibacterium luteolum]SDG69749.1 alcohol dehydrogenase (cytochrome c) [Pelagibacterium luteolum]
MRNFLLLSTTIVVGLLPIGYANAQVESRLSAFTDVSDETLLNPGDGDWLHWRRTYDGWGYSPLEEINKENVGDLQVAWTWSLTPGATETTPIVHDGVLFVHNNLDKVQAIDGASGDLLWEYNRDLPEDVVAAGTGNTATKRNMAIYEDMIILATSDTHIIALDARTGQEVWSVEPAAWSDGFRYSSGPLIADGVVVQGMTGCGNAQPGGCFITGHDPATGDELWRFHSIAQDGEEGDTWNDLPIESRHGASVWLAATYDPDTNTVFSGVGQPYPWIAEMSGLLPAVDTPGVSNDALYTDSTLALDPQTGELKWYFQHLPNDTWDLDYIYERILVDLPVDGEVREQVITTGKLGIVEALDRNDGSWLWSVETVPQNVISAIDPETGDKTINEETIPMIGQTTFNCPADPGGRGWPATAYSPRTETLYLPLAEFCSNTTPQPLDPGQAYTGGGRATFARVEVPDSDGNIGRLDAINLADHSTAWSHRQRSPITSAVLPTGGGLVFAGDWNRYFYAFDDETGDVLWQIRTNNAVNSFPISYEADGKQYVAVAVGNGSSQARALATLTPEFVNPAAGSVLWVFTLP